MSTMKRSRRNGSDGRRSRHMEVPGPFNSSQIGADVKYEVPIAAAEDVGVNPALLGSVAVLLLVFSVIILRLVKLQRDEAAARERADAILAMAEADGQDGRRGANDEYNFREIIGKKKAMKLEAKAAKKAAREQELIEREERKKREKERDDQMEKERERERAEEAAREQAEQREREEREKRELEEYLKEEGFDHVDEEERENRMRNFVRCVKEAKVVNVDELAAHFWLTTEEAIDRLNRFLAAGDLIGVMDERGRFIYVTQEEMQAVAKFINQHGRVYIGS